ncbi:MULTISPECIES: glycosyltransferase [Aerosakkonema]|uniref:glycosyltransferase n=1 Tax=Aerosakkonema TaxID=1246629 RepID=UPI0035BB4D3D
MLVSVITPTTGDPLLKQNVESIQNQDYKNIEHIIVIDGKEREDEAFKIINKIELKKQTYVVTWPYATGKDRFNGHRIYGANCYLANGDYLVFLDEDNWVDENHISSLVELVSKWQLDWAYSLRKILDRQGNFIT